MTYGQLRGHPGRCLLHQRARRHERHGPDARSSSTWRHRTGTAGRASAPALPTITDGTSNTSLFGEHAHARISTTGPHAGDVYGANWWTSGDYGDTTASSLYPPNFFQTNEDGYKLPASFPRGDNFDMTFASMHPSSLV